MKPEVIWAQSVGLIPRYNWDFGLRELITGLLALFGRKQPSDNSLQFFGARPIFTASGRASLFAILRGLQLPPRAEIGVPLFCCAVVFEAVRQAGYRPRFIDVNPADFNMSAADLERKQKSLSAVLVVHMFGQPADVDAISSVCNVPLIEDCAQSFLSTCRGRPTGHSSIAAFFSFRSGKYLSVGEASIIYCRDASLHTRIQKVVAEFRQPGILGQTRHCLSTYLKSSLYHRPWYGAVSCRLGKRLDSSLNLTARSGFEAAQITQCDLAVLSHKLDGCGDRVECQRQNALYLLKNLRVRHARLPSERPGCQSNYYQFPLRFRTTEQRDAVAAHLYRCGVDTAKYLDDLVCTAKKSYFYDGDCPEAERLSKTTLVIPHYYSLSPRSLAHVCSCINEADARL